MDVVLADTRIVAEIVGPAEALVLGFAVSGVWAVVVEGVDVAAVAVAVVAARRTWKALAEDSCPLARQASALNPF